MIILGNRILVSKVEEEIKEGFKTVEVQDNFVYKGKVEQIGQVTGIKEGDIVLFSKYSPDTQEIDHEGQKMKIINVDDVLAILNENN